MNREIHARLRKSLRVRRTWATRPIIHGTQSAGAPTEVNVLVSNFTFENSLTTEKPIDES